MVEGQGSPGGGPVPSHTGSVGCFNEITPRLRILVEDYPRTTPCFIGFVQDTDVLPFVERRQLFLQASFVMVDFHIVPSAFKLFTLRGWGWFSVIS